MLREKTLVYCSMLEIIFQKILFELFMKQTRDKKDTKSVLKIILVLVDKVKKFVIRYQLQSLH